MFCYRQYLKLLLFSWLLLSGFKPKRTEAQPAANAPLLVRKCADFSIAGNGSHPEWAKAEWNPLLQLDSGVRNYETRFKILYSPKGIYLLFSGRDRKLTAPYNHDFEALFNADVFEVFLQPDPALPLYLEYEINPLNKELVLLVPNFTNPSSAWMPWHYEGGRKVKKKVSVEGGEGKNGARIDAWSAELFIPFELLATLPQVPPKSGTVWNANFYRLDYDTGNMIKWAWSPVAQSFHEYEKFGAIRFE